jgi:peroxiredoxin
VNRAVRVGLIVAVAVAAGLAGMWTRQSTTSRPEAAVPAGGGAKLLALTLPDPAGAPQALAQWRGKVVVANFWATWCPPCLKEIPGFAEVSRKLAARGVQFVGISIDSPDQVARFQQEKAVPYPLLIGSAETLQLSAELGNGPQALPFTLILDAHGEIRHVKLGTWSEADLEARIRPLLAPG